MTTDAESTRAALNELYEALSGFSIRDYISTKQRNAVVAVLDRHARRAKAEALREAADRCDECAVDWETSAELHQAGEECAYDSGAAYIHRETAKKMRIDAAKLDGGSDV
jgi:hypothetical protein